MSTGVKGTIYLIVTQVVSRGLTFIGNQALLRYVSPSHLGLAVQLEALSISILYTSRESLRVTLQRSPRAQASEQNGQLIQSAVNAAWLVVVLGLILNAVFATIYLGYAGTLYSQTPNFSLAFWLYDISTVLEILSEPCFIVVQQHFLFKSRARAETTGAIARCIASCAAAIVMNRNQIPLSVLPFAIGQVFYGLSLFVVYVRTAGEVANSHGFSLLPVPLQDTSNSVFSRFPKPLLALAGAFYGQSVFKWLLTQGDTLVLSMFANLQSQGIFALASNYGGLASRLLFQPIEESSRNMFGALLSNSENPSSSISKRPRISPEAVQKRESALQYLAKTIRLYILIIAIPCCTIIPQIFPIVIQILLGARSQWNSEQTSALLSAYSYYIPCLAVNGILDSFVTSVATDAELGAQSLMMVGVTMIYLSATYFGMTALQLGAVVLVYANILNMLLRIGFSVWFIKGWTQENLPTPTSSLQASPFRQFVHDCLPNRTSLVTAPLVSILFQAQPHIKSALAGNSTIDSLIEIKVSRLNIDLFDVNYIFTAAIILISSILISEKDFLISGSIPLLPERLKSALNTYLPTMKKADSQDAVQQSKDVKSRPS